MKSVAFLPGARDEFLAQVQFYEEERPGLGMRFATAVESATSRALDFPLAGHPLHADTRRILTQGFPFSLVYRQVDDGILVVAVPHHSREPNYWKGRQE